ncbi:MAG: PilZ domain-containing protein [Gammaproteobacteria bacterium]|nr:PilZ domain-containing protein [Gammaproteobacteria bacterium]
MDRQNVQSYVEQNKKEKQSGRKDNRRFQRYNVSFKVHIKLSSGEIVTGQAKNISKGGIYVEYGSSAEMGREFELMFAVMLNNDIEQVYARGKVVRCFAIAGRNVFGIAFVFLALHNDSEKVLDRYLHRCYEQFPHGY